MLRHIGHLRGAFHYFGLSWDVVRYILDHDRRTGYDNIHPLDWREWRDKRQC